MFKPKLLNKFIRVSIKDEKMSNSASAAMIASDQSRIRIKLCGEAEGHAALIFRMITEKTDVAVHNRPSMESADTTPRDLKTC